MRVLDQIPLQPGVHDGIAVTYHVPTVPLNTSQEPFPITTFSQIQMNAEERNYLVKGLLPRSGLAVVWGPPKSGKSFWCMDLLLHVALQWEYRGRKVQQANVVYVALEGRNGIPARVEAFKTRHEVKEAPFYLMTRPVNLVADADALIASIKAQGVKPDVICLDTLNRSLVGSESRDEDMTAYIAAAGKIEEAFECLVIIVHHCGVDATRPRGHTSLTGAVDGMAPIIDTTAIIYVAVTAVARVCRRPRRAAPRRARRDAQTVRPLRHRAHSVRSACAASAAMRRKPRLSAGAEETSARRSGGC